MKYLSAVARRLFGPYVLCRIYSLSLENGPRPGSSPWTLGPIRNAEEMKRSSDPTLRHVAYCATEGAHGFGAWSNGELASACWFWGAELYNRERSFWPLEAQEAKLIELATAEPFRGRGIAPKLMGYASNEMKKLGYRRLFARVWHSNRSSITAFRKAGWVYVAFVVLISPFGVKKPLRFVHTRANP